MNTVAIEQPSIQHRKHDRIMQFLYRIAVDVEPVDNQRIAAAIVYKNDIISVAWGELKSHPFQAKFGKNEHAIFLHAEVSAIRKALNHIAVDDFKKATLYVQRVTRTGEWGLSKPCCGCAKAITAFGIGKVIYSTGTNLYSSL